MSPGRSALSLRVIEECDCVVVRFAPGTTLSGANCEQLATELAVLAAREPRPHLLIDLGGVNMLTSLVLAKLISLNNALRADGGRLTIANAQPVVREVFKVTKLDTLLEIAI